MASGSERHQLSGVDVKVGDFPAQRSTVRSNVCTLRRTGQVVPAESATRTSSLPGPVGVCQPGPPDDFDAAFARAALVVKRELSLRIGGMTF